MYKITGMADDRVRAVISKEMASGLRKVFLLDEDAKGYEIKGRLREVLKCDRNLGYYYLKLRALIGEIEDGEFEYSFDDEGKALVIMASRYAADTFDSWEAAADWLTERTIRKTIRIYMDSLEGTFIDVDDLKDYKNQVLEETVKRCFYFPWFCFEIDDDPAILKDLLFGHCEMHKRMYDKSEKADEYESVFDDPARSENVFLTGSIKTRIAGK